MVVGNLTVVVDGFATAKIKYEPVHEEANNSDSDQVRHKPACIATEKG